jgi:hypothetical protein
MIMMAAIVGGAVQINKVSTARLPVGGLPRQHACVVRNKDSLPVDLSVAECGHHCLPRLLCNVACMR